MKEDDDVKENDEDEAEDLCIERAFLYKHEKRIGSYKYFSLIEYDNENPTLCLLNNSNLKQVKGKKKWKKKKRKTSVSRYRTR